MADRRTTKRGEGEQDEVLRQQIATTRALLAKAVQSDNLPTAVRAQTLLARLTADLERRTETRRAASIKDPIKRMQVMRELAEADGSWVAAARMGAEEQKMRAARAAKEHAEAEAAMVGMTEEEVLAELVQAAMALPVQLRARLAASIRTD